MFTDNPNIEKIHEGVYIYRNFLDKKFVEKISAKILEIGDGVDLKHSNNWYEDKVYQMEEMAESYKKASELLLPELYIVPSIMILITKPGDEMFVHTDSPEEDQHVDSPDPFETCHIVDYGIVIYYGDWTGGDVFYPDLGISVSPRPGDLLIHKSRNPYSHGVRKIESGVRGAQSLFAVTAEKNPGTFVVYGSKEFKDIEESNTPLAWTDALIKR
jgi:hypothetical protein